MQRSFKSRLEALEKLEAIADRSDLTRYSDHDLYSCAALLLTYNVFWEFGKPGDFAPHIERWNPNAAEQAYYAEKCAAAGLDGWDYQKIWALCRWLNARDADERATALDWHKRWWAAFWRLTDAELSILGDAPESDAAQALLSSLYEEVDRG